VDLWTNFLNYKPRIVSPSRYGIFSYRGRISNEFNGKPLVVVANNNEYASMEALTDYFIEPERMRARRNDEKHTPYARFAADHIRFNVDALSKVELKSLRDQVYRTAHESTLFRLSWCKGVLEILKKEIGIDHPTMLDPFAGWGDRLLTAICCDCRYFGFDPNLGLYMGHSAMIEYFGDISEHSVQYVPFEDAVLDHINPDIIFTSPPYFDLEHYCDNPNQSDLRYPRLVEWLEFWSKSIEKMWKCLNIGGVCAIHIADHKIEHSNVSLIDYTHKEFARLGARFIGVIGLASTRNRDDPVRQAWPVWVWKRI
jgi:hypothetical protein